MSLINIQQSLRQLTDLHRQNSLTKKDIKGELALFQAIIQTSLPKVEQNKILYCLEKIDYFAKEIGGAKLEEKVLKVTCELLEKMEVSENQMPDDAVRLVFVNDAESLDHNGAMSLLASSALRARMPLITSWSVISGDNIESSNGKDRKIQALRSAIYENFEKFNIYKQIHGEFLIFLPKWQETLEDLGLQPAELVKVSKIEEIFEQPRVWDRTIDSFFSLFDENKITRKNIVISGHGGSQRIAAFSHQNYRKFLTFIQKTGTEHLRVVSCNGGSKNLFQHKLSDGTSPDFPITVMSRGNFNTTVIQARGIYKTHYSDFEKFKNIQIPHHLAFHKATRMSFSKFNNMPHVRLPSKRKELQFFRPIGKHQDFKNTILTNNALSRIKLAPFHPAGRSHVYPPQIRHKSPRLNIINRGAFEIYPLVIDIPVNISQKIPFFHSLIPGNCHHYFKELNIDSDFNNLLKSAYSIGLTCKANKAFFFETVNAPGKTYREAMLFYSKDNCYLIYQEGSKFYKEAISNKGKITREAISAHKFQFMILSSLMKTLPAQKAIDKSAGVKEKFKAVWNIVKKKKEFGLQNELFEMPDDQIDHDKCNQWIAKYKSNPQNLFEIALFLKKPKIALSILNFYKINLNKRDALGNSLFVQAIFSKDRDLVQKFLALKAKGNQESAKGITPLVAAVAFKDVELINQLLEHYPNIAKSKNGKEQPLLYSNNSKIWELLIQKGANPHHRNSDKQAFAYSDCAVFPKSIEEYKEMQKIKEVKLLFDLPSILVQAIRSGDLNYVQFLLKEGFDPLKRSKNGQIPFIEAACSTPEIFALVSKGRKKAGASLVDRFGETAYKKAYYASAWENFAELEKKAGLKKHAYLFKEALGLRDYKNAQKFLPLISKRQKIEFPNSQSVFQKDQTAFIKYLLNNKYNVVLSNPKIIVGLIKKKSKFNESFFSKCLANYLKNSKTNRNDTELLHIAYKAKNVEAFKIILQKGVIPYKDIVFMKEITGNEEFLQLCILHSKRPIPKGLADRLIKVAKNKKLTNQLKILKQAKQNYKIHKKIRGQCFSLLAKYLSKIFFLFKNE